MQQAVCDGLCQRVQPMIAGRMPRTVQVDIPQGNNRSEDATGVYSLTFGQAVPDRWPAYLPGCAGSVAWHRVQPRKSCGPDNLDQSYYFCIFHQFSLVA
jgi:hypothetical protein